MITLYIKKSRGLICCVRIGAWYHWYACVIYYSIVYTYRRGLIWRVRIGAWYHWYLCVCFVHSRGLFLLCANRSVVCVCSRCSNTVHPIWCVNSLVEYWDNTSVSNCLRPSKVQMLFFGRNLKWPIFFVKKFLKKTSFSCTVSKLIAQMLSRSKNV